MDVWGFIFTPLNLPWKLSKSFVLTVYSLIVYCPLSYLKLYLFFPNFLGTELYSELPFLSAESLLFDSGTSLCCFLFFFFSGDNGLSPHACAGLSSPAVTRQHSLLAMPLSSQATVTAFFNKGVQQSIYMPNSSHMLPCCTAFEMLSSLFIISKEAVKLPIILKSL